MSIESLVSPLGGMVSRVTGLPTAAGDPSFAICSAALGDLAQLLPNVRESAGSRSVRGQMDGAGGGLGRERAQMLAVAEALERYSSCVFDERQLRWATRDELGEEALDLQTVPRCSERELAHPHCPVVAPDDGARMRWVRGVSLITQRPTWVPAVMVYMHIPPAVRSECFTLPISTGCATHTDLAAALLNATCEVIERDAISLTWLQRLALPRLVLDRLPPDLAAAWARAQNGDVTVHLFDATTDLGVPTIYGVETSDHNPRLATVVMCATDVDPARAVTKVLREGASCRIALGSSPPAPDSVEQFVQVFDGAVYMGAPERRTAFRFLLDTPNTRRLSEMAKPATGDAVGDLRFVLARLAAAGLEAVAVDLTTDEALRSGFRVVRVVVPGLQPLSFAHLARYLGHPRLYDAPALMGHPVNSEQELNPWPQPFA
jgi:ribosomal protein S12 methylthiotransferase accessory factor